MRPEFCYAVPEGALPCCRAACDYNPADGPAAAGAPRIGCSQPDARMRELTHAAMGRFVLVLSRYLDAKKRASFVSKEAERY